VGFSLIWQTKMEKENKQTSRAASRSGLAAKETRQGSSSRTSGGSRNRGVVLQGPAITANTLKGRVKLLLSQGGSQGNLMKKLISEKLQKGRAQIGKSKAGNIFLK